MAVGNTFGATALSSYGGFWIAYGILLTPNWNILGADGPYAVAGKAAGDPHMANSAVGFFLTGWFIFTTILMLCTLRSTIMFFSLFFTLDLAFLMLACGEYATNNGAAKAAVQLTKAGGGFGMLAAFLAWYNAFAGIADTRYVTPPLAIQTSILPFPTHNVGSATRMPLVMQILCRLVASSAFPHLWASVVPRCGRCQAQATRVMQISSRNPRHVPTSPAPLSNHWNISLTLSTHSNSFFLIPVFHFPWSEKGRENRIAKSESHTA
jgi:succinate-acetate transporter protein